MSLATQIVADVAGVFMNTADFAVAITYERRGATVALNAIPDSSLYESSNAFGITQTKTKDFLIEASTLILDGVLTKPAKGDTITVGAKRYAVTSQQGGRPDSYDDDSELIWRVNATFSEAF